MRFIQLMTLSLTLAAPGVSLAESGSGRYSTHDVSESVETLPDDSKVTIFRYTQMLFATETSFPLDSQSSDCVGRTHVSAEGELISSGGVCTSYDSEGTSSWWWRVDRDAECEMGCGSWAYFSGTGLYEGIVGTGTWSTDSVFPNGVTAGTWQADVTLKK